MFLHVHRWKLNRVIVFYHTTLKRTDIIDRCRCGQERTRRV